MQSFRGRAVRRLSTWIALAWLALPLWAHAAPPGAERSGARGDYAAGRTRAPAFAIRTLDGKLVRLTELRGRPVVLDFWATWCVPCRATMPQLDTLQIRYRDQGLVVLGLALDDDAPHEVRRFAGRFGIRFPMALADERVLDLYGPIRAIPTTYYIDRRGEIVRRVVGSIDAETVESYVRELLTP